MAAELLSDTAELARELKDRRAFFRLVAVAQKAALIDWRDRDRNPGLAARFDYPAHRYYGFAERGTYYTKYKRNLPDFYRTGGLKRMLMSRKPQNKRQDSEIRTVLKLGGGKLNWLKNSYGGSNAASSVVVAYRLEPVKAHIRVRLGQQQSVRAHLRKVATETRTKAPESHAQQFADLTRDNPFIERRAKVHLKRLLAEMRVKRGGKISNRYLTQLEARLR